ncbi:MAG: coaE [Rhizobium sp.]|nr:coaE [Rhizobium sp.]
MIRLGLTGSIGMGKSTTAKMFRDRGVPVIDADAVVHELYRGEAVEPIEAAFPGSTQDGVVDRAQLAALLAKDPAGFKTLEAIVHPLVWQREKQLVEQLQSEDTPVVVLDIPLLFENGGEYRVDKVVVVTADSDVQKARVLARPGMTEEKYKMILSRQMADSEKRRRADFIIDTGLGMQHARQRVDEILEQLQQ